MLAESETQLTSIFLDGDGSYNLTNNSKIEYSMATEKLNYSLFN